ncbi:hypothetical protein [Knoellia subterranea]|uniref:hypothetical protein n=1 Tax=Knoellia subterranea TaxID=184882 RepID=UPI000563937D|nr:hypothetical protein [Knoellia subterranea]
MTTAGDLRARAARWRLAAETTRREVASLVRLAELTWRAPTADAFRRNIAVRVRELRELAAREDAVADLLDRVATESARAA